jgi:hypothetical protein
MEIFGVLDLVKLRYLNGMGTSLWKYQRRAYAVGSFLSTSRLLAIQLSMSTQPLVYLARPVRPETSKPCGIYLLD